MIDCESVDETLGDPDELGDSDCVRVDDCVELIDWLDDDDWLGVCVSVGDTDWVEELDILAVTV